MPSPLDRFKRKKQEPKPWLQAIEAKQLAAEQVADALGIGYELQGRHIELDNGMRGTTKPDGVVWCEKNGAGIGDNLALAMAVTGKPFRAALELLLGYAESNPYVPPANPSAGPLRLPMQRDQEQGRAYLRSRGFSNQAIAAAEKSQMLRYTQGAVLFVGYRDDRPMSVTRRSYRASDAVSKRDFKGSDKSCPPILIGNVQAHVWVVEGGADALALWTLYPVEKWPTVIVSGGSNCRAFIDQEHITPVLKAARRVTIGLEREKDEETQMKTRAQHEIQADLIRKHCDCVDFWEPPAGVKDLGERVLSDVAASPSSEDTPPLTTMEKHA